jgi:hypothetical protein
MMDRREQLRSAEEATWAELSAEVARLTVPERDRPGFTPDGWSASDVVWHCAHWCLEAAAVLEEKAAGTFREGDHDLDDEATDARNARTLEESRAMSWEQVDAGAHEARRRVRAAWEALPAIDDDSAEWFADETVDHYADHLGQVRPAAPDG